MTLSLWALLRSPSDEDGRRWSYHRAVWLLGFVAIVLLWRGTPYATQDGALLLLVGALIALVGRRGLGLYLVAIGVGLLVA